MARAPFHVLCTDLIQHVERCSLADPKPSGDFDAATKAKIARHFKLWSECWIIPNIKTLQARGAPRRPVHPLIDRVRELLDWHDRYGLKATEAGDQAAVDQIIDDLRNAFDATKKGK